MGGFFKNILKMGATGAATATGGPLAGAAMSGGLNMAESFAKGGGLGDMLLSGASGAGGSYLSGELGKGMSDYRASKAPDLVSIPSFKPNMTQFTPDYNKTLLDALKFNY